MTDDPQRPGLRTGLRPDTKIVHGGRRDEWLHGMVSVPVSRTSTVLFEDVEAMNAASPPRDGVLNYGRNGTPTQWSLAEALTELEPGAAGTLLLPSGAAAVAFALMSVLEPGDELLMVDSVYGPTRTFCDQWLKRFGVTTRYYDPLAGADEIEAMLSEQTRAIFMESPGSLTFEVQGRSGICTVARRAASQPCSTYLGDALFFQARGHGVDLSIVACTKYISGHADVMLGSVPPPSLPGKKLAKAAHLYGQHVSPDDAYLASRGLRTSASVSAATKIARSRSPAGSTNSRRWRRFSPGVQVLPWPPILETRLHRRNGSVSIVLKDADDATAIRSSKAWTCSGSAIAGAASRAWLSPSTRSDCAPSPAICNRRDDPPPHRARG